MHLPADLPPLCVNVLPSIVEGLGLGSDELQIASLDRYGGRVRSHADRCSHRLLRLPFDGALQMLLDAKVLLNDNVDDFSTAHEKQLGVLVRERYGVDIYVVDQFPVSARPFYTAALSVGSNRTRSFDMYLRGEEICSGAQRIHCPSTLSHRAMECGVSIDLIKNYIDSFRFGAWPHAGFGLGLERIVMFYVAAPDVRLISLFPRDPRRLFP